MARKAGQSLSGAALRAARVMADLSQADLAQGAGVHAKTVAYWERRGSRGNWNEIGLRRILEALRSRGVEVMRGEGEGVRRLVTVYKAVTRLPKCSEHSDQASSPELRK
jgi:transcriptional regulator with XRE-family HTH domain